MKKYITSIALCMTIIGCSDVDFGDAVVNPNEPSQVESAPLLSGGQAAVMDIYGATTPALYVQYLANEQYEEESLYATKVFDYASYYQAITNLNIVIDKPSSVNQAVVAELTKAYYFNFMTDAWGMIPYFTANKIDVVFNVFDTQESIYKDLFKKIDENLKKIDDSTVEGDILFKGDMAKWKRFGYSLMMNMALRVSKVDPALGKKYYNKAKGKVVSTNAENLFFPFQEDENYDNPWQDTFQTRTDYLVCKTLIDAMVGDGDNDKAPEDPRLPFYAEPAQAGPQEGKYNGAVYGVKNAETKNYSFITHDIIKNQTAKGYIFTAAQMLFDQAEAASLGWDSDPAGKYEKAVKASMEQWGVDSAKADAYVAANPYVDAKSIGYEKWVALYMQGYESWFDWRKQLANGNNKPLVKPEKAFSKGIPNRLGYPLSASGNNKKNYDAAVAKQGADDLDTKVWWAK